MIVAEKVKPNEEEIKVNKEEEQNTNYGVIDLIECPDGEQAKDAIESILDIKKIEFAPQPIDTNSNTKNINMGILYSKTTLISTNKEKISKLLVQKRELLEEKKLIEKVSEGQFAMALCNYLNIVVFQGVLYGLAGNWEKLDDSPSGNLNKFILNLAGDRKTNFLKEVKAQILIFARYYNDSKNLPILLNNGYLVDGKFYEYDENKIKPFSPYQINLDYNPNCKKVEIVDEYLNNLSSGEIEYRSILEEILGYCLMTNYDRKGSLSKFFFLVGDGGNGKGTFLKIVSRILGEENYSSVSSQQIADEKYNNNLKGKLANLGDDVPNKPLNDAVVKILKNISSCDEIALRNLFNDAHNYRLTATLIFTSNHILKSWEKDYAFKRRIIWIPMYYKPQKVDPNFLDKITTKEALEYWLYLAIQGYNRLYENEKFSESEIINKFNSEYHKENNNIEVYLEFKTIDDFANKKPKEVFEEYQAWCEDEGLEPLSKSSLDSNVKTKYNLEIGSVRVEEKDLFDETVTKTITKRAYKPKKE